MDIKSEIITKFEEALLAKNSCTPEFVAHLCDLIGTGEGISQNELVSLVESELYGKH